MPRKTELHPLPLRRRLNAKERAYLKCVFHYMPIVKKELERVYPKFQSELKTKYADPLETMLQKKANKALEKLPARVKILVAKLQRKPLNTKALFRKERAGFVVKTRRKKRRITLA